MKDLNAAVPETDFPKGLFLQPYMFSKPFQVT
jgi:hypothetical protein